MALLLPQKSANAPLAFLSFNYLSSLGRRWLFQNSPDFGLPSLPAGHVAVLLVDSEPERDVVVVIIVPVLPQIELRQRLLCVPVRPVLHPAARLDLFFINAPKGQLFLEHGSTDVGWGVQTPRPVVVQNHVEDRGMAVEEEFPGRRIVIGVGLRCVFRQPRQPSVGNVSQRRLVCLVSYASDVDDHFVAHFLAWYAVFAGYQGHRPPWHPTRTPRPWFSHRASSLRGESQNVDVKIVSSCATLIPFQYIYPNPFILLSLRANNTSNRFCFSQRVCRASQKTWRKQSVARAMLPTNNCRFQRTPTDVLNSDKLGCGAQLYPMTKKCTLQACCSSIAGAPQSSNGSGASAGDGGNVFPPL